MNKDVMDENLKLYCDKKMLEKTKINRDFLSSEKMVVTENNLFKDKYNDVQRINIEYNRIKEKLNSDSNLLVTYIDKFTELEKMISMISFDKSLIKRVKVKIVELQILCGIKVRFTSVIAEALKNEKVAIMLLKEYEKNSYLDILPEYYNIHKCKKYENDYKNDDYDNKDKVINYEIKKDDIKDMSR